MFSNLSDKLDKVFRKLRSYGKLTEENIAESLREVRIALLEADVNYKVVADFINKVKGRAVDKEVLASLTPGEHVIGVVHDELINLLGGSVRDISFAGDPAVIMMTGLQGSGKTTTCGKIAHWLKSNKREKILFISGDIYRPAAEEQLKVLANGIGAELFSNAEFKDNAVELCKRGVAKGRAERFDAVIVDTAGRLHIDEEMMEELIQVKAEVKPTEVLLVVDAMTGQEAVNVATAFNNRVGIDGIVLTKMDGDARGGAALSIRSVTGKPIKFIGVGEKMSELSPFYPDRMASRILGMGDVLSLIEKAKEIVNEESALNLHNKIKSDGFSLNDFLVQLKNMKKIGTFEQILSMLPGMDKLKGVKVDEKKFSKIEAIINSMTMEERLKEGIINNSRRERIAKGSGTTVNDVNRLLKQFRQMKQMMKKFSNFNGKMKGLPMGKKGMFPNMGKMF